MNEQEKKPTPAPNPLLRILGYYTPKETITAERSAAEILASKSMGTYGKMVNWDEVNK